MFLDELVRHPCFEMSPRRLNPKFPNDEKSDHLPRFPPQSNEFVIVSGGQAGKWMPNNDHGGYISSKFVRAMVKDKNDEFHWH